MNSEAGVAYAAPQRPVLFDLRMDYPVRQDAEDNNLPEVLYVPALPPPYQRITMHTGQEFVVERIELTCRADGTGYYTAVLATPGSKNPRPRPVTKW